MFVTLDKWMVSPIGKVISWRACRVILERADTSDPENEMRIRDAVFIAGDQLDQGNVMECVKTLTEFLRLESALVLVGYGTEPEAIKPEGYIDG